MVLARACIFGYTMLLKSSPSGKGYFTSQLDPQKLTKVKVIVRQRARHLSDGEFEAVWAKCVVSISKTCQNLRSGRLTPNSVKL